MSAGFNGRASTTWTGAAAGISEGGARSPSPPWSAGRAPRAPLIDAGIDARAAGGGAASPRVPGSELCGTDGRGSVMGTLRRKLLETARAFFSPNSEGSDDPLIEVVRRDPRAASRFLRAVMLFSGVGGAAVALICAVFLAFNWAACGGCDRPLRWWLLVHTILQLTQVPVRFVFLARLRNVQSDARSTEACVAAFTASPAWRASKQVSLVTYGWFVLGVVWVLNAGNCKMCPSIYMMTVAVIVQAIARAAAAVACFRALFPREDPTMAGAAQVEAATPEQVSALPTVRFSRGLFDDPGASCAVCLSEYVSGDLLRKLPCGHHFHRRCADKWLARSKKCPLCMGAIDAPPASFAGLRRKAE